MPLPILTHTLIPGPTLDDDRRRFRDELVTLGRGVAGHHLILDISQLAVVDSSMLGTLALFAKTLPAGSRLVVVGANPTVRTVLMVTRFDSVIPLADTVAQGRAILAAH